MSSAPPNFADDGVTVVRGVVGPALVERLRHAFTAQAPRARAAGDERRGFWMRSHAWSEEPVIAEAVFGAGLPEVAAAEAGSGGLWLYEESLLAKDAGAEQATPWHQDLVSYPLAGWQVVTVWLSLDEVDAGESAVRYVRGSHRWGARYAPTGFLSEQVHGSGGLRPFEGGDGLPELAFSTAPGDCVVHHGLVLHRAPGNPTGRPRRALAVSYVGEDVRFEEPAVPWSHPLEDRLRAAATPQDVLPQVLPRGPVASPRTSEAVLP